MNPTLLPLLGAGAGALVGAGLGASAGFILRRRTASVIVQQPIGPPVVQSDKAAMPVTVTPPKATPPTTKGRFQVLDIPTNYLSPGNTALFTPLMRLDERLQWEEERYALGFVIGHMDRLLGMESSMASRTDLRSRAALPTLAHEATVRARRLLHEILEFSHEQRPSPTKREAMEAIVKELSEAMDTVVENITRALAAGPMDMSR
jgi:hypothetical protein